MTEISLNHFQQKRFHYVFANARGLPENAFRMQIEMEVLGLNVSADSGLLPGFALGCLAMGEGSLRIAFRECPLIATPGFNEEKLDTVVLAQAVANSRDLQGQSKL